MNQQSPKRIQQRGFTLAEMAIVVVLAGILLTMGMKMTVANLNNGAYTKTSGNMALIKTALISYLRTYGTLPCPDITAAPGVPTGNAAAACNASLAQGSGVVPWKTLGLPLDTVQDGWGNLFVYRIDNGFAANTRNWSSKTVLNNSFDMGQLTVPWLGLTINQTDGVLAPTLVTSNAVAVILSAGKSGYGARTIQGQTNVIPPAGNLDEVTNMTAGQTTFVVRPVTDSKTVRGTHSDVLIYLLPQDLLQPLVTEQTVLACRAYCACTGLATPYAYCTAQNLPAAPPSAPCTGPGAPVAGCTGKGTPAACTVQATVKVPVGYPNPQCP